MKMLTSTWGIALLAALLNIGTTGGLIYLNRGQASAPELQEAERKAAVPKFWSFRAEDVDALVLELKSERARLVTRQTELDKVAVQVEAEKQELEKTRAEIVAMREEIARKVPEMQETEVKNFKTLAQTYSIMTPLAVVAIFAEMDETMTVKILAMMKPDKVAGILQEMARTRDKDDTMAKRAARLSDRLRLLKPIQKPTAQL